MSFKKLRDAIVAQFNKMQAASPTLYTTNLERDTVWKVEREEGAEFSTHTSIYLDAFDAAERQHHTCSCCRSFLRNYANVVQLDANLNMVTIWDVEADDEYRLMVDAMRAAVLASQVNGIFVAQLTKDNHMSGTNLVLGPQNIQILEDNTARTWEHFTLSVDKNHISSPSKSAASIIGEANSARAVFMRSLTEITDEAIAIVIDMMTDNDTLRLDEFVPMVTAFKAFKDAFMLLEPGIQREHYAWLNFSVAGGAVSRMRNTSIGTLLTDLSEGKEVNWAKASFERMMSQYKRSTTEATPKQKKEAAAAFEAAGLIPSLARRHANKMDVSVPDTSWVDRTVQVKDNNPFNLLSTTKVDVAKLNKVTEMSIAKFMTDILPKLTSLEVLLESHHVNHLMNITAAVHADVPLLTKWNNDKMWAYNGDVADSIKARVAAAGGNVNGALRVSLSWHNSDDLDLHLYEPGGSQVYYGNKNHRVNGATLDVDMNAWGVRDDHKPVENIVWPVKEGIKEGKHRIRVNQYTNRMNERQGYTVELEYEGVIQRFEVAQNGGTTTVIAFEYTRAGGVRIIENESVRSSKSATQGVKVWGLETNQFHKCQMVVNSPNYWGDNAIGNKHTMFLLEGCLNPDKPRGFFMEHLPESLKAYRKTLEELGDKHRVEYSDDQLAGVGFNNTTRNTLIVRAEGVTERIIKILF